MGNKRDYTNEQGWFEFFDNHYYATTTGQIVARRTSQYLKQYTNKNGYKTISISVGGIRKNWYVHRLVAITFLPNPEHKPCVNHIDNNRGNNDFVNLEWVTYKENTDHMVKQGRYYSIPTRSKLTHCKNGHKFTDENTMILSNGDRRCRQCKRNYERLRTEQRERNKV